MLSNMKGVFEDALAFQPDKIYDVIPATFQDPQIVAVVEEPIGPPVKLISVRIEEKFFVAGSKVAVIGSLYGRIRAENSKNQVD